LKLAAMVAADPRDPETAVDVTHVAGEMRIRLDAVDVTLRPVLLAEGTEPIALDRVSPGRWEGSLSAQTAARAVVVRSGDVVVDVISQPGGYPAELAEVGLDRFALQAMAKASAGRVVEPDERIRIEAGMKKISVAGPMYGLATLCVLLAIVRRGQAMSSAENRAARRD
jgi:hypothetical protein